MAIFVNWPTKVIAIPQSFLTLLGTTYQLDVNVLRLALKDEEDSENGSMWPDTHRHSTQSTLSGVTYSRIFEIINGYTITFEDTGTPYTVTCIGANHNLADVTNFTSEVSLIVGNSSGLISVVSGGTTGPTASSIADAVWTRMLLLGDPAGSASNIIQTVSANSAFIKSDVITINNAIDTIDLLVHLLIKYQKNRTKVDAFTKTLTIYDDDNITPITIFNLKDLSGTASVSEVAERDPIYC